MVLGIVHPGWTNEALNAECAEGTEKELKELAG